MATTTPTSIGPIGVRQINNTLYVGQNDLTTIQAAVNAATKMSGVVTVTIPANYAGSDTIAAVTGGLPNINLLDMRGAQWQIYVWNITHYQAGTFAQETGLVSFGKPVVPAASAAFYFDPAGTSGAGTGHIDITAVAGEGMPSFNLTAHPSDGTDAVTFFRCQMSIPGPIQAANIPQIEAPIQLGLFNTGFPSYNLWTGDYYETGGKGMTIWARPDENAIDLQGETLGGAYDQVIRLNYFGGDVLLGPSITVDALGNIIGAGDITASSVAAADATFDTCEVDNSPVRTFANTADAPAGMIWPPIGIAVSAGAAWGTSINPASIAYLNAANIFTTDQTINGILSVDNNKLRLIDSAGAVGSGGPNINSDGFNMVLNASGAGTIKFNLNQGTGGIQVNNGAGNAVFTIDKLGNTVVNGNITASGSLTFGTTGTGGISWTAPAMKLAAVNSVTNLRGGYQFDGFSSDYSKTITYFKMYDDASLGPIASFPNSGLGVSGIFTAAASVRVGPRAPSTQWQTGTASVNADAINLVLNPPNGTGSVYLNADQGTGGVKFCSGAAGTVIVGTVDSLGNASFNGGVSPGNGLLIPVCPAPIAQVPNSVRLTQSATSAYLDLFGPSSTVQGTLWIRTLTSTASPNVPVAQFTSTLVTLGVDTHVSGAFTATTKSFLIDHPTDPGKSLIHSCLEGPENGVYYRGEGVTAGGWAELTLPDYFEALTMPEGRSVLLTALFEDDAEQVGMLAASRVKDGRFKVWSALPIQKFYWEVKAVRSDIEPLQVDVARRPKFVQTEGEEANANDEK